MILRQPDPTELWFLPLGGCGEIGMNLNLFGHNGQWLMVDCGITFERTAQGEQRIEMPATAAAEHLLDDLCGMIATHAHEDHIGALPHLKPALKAPIYTTPFTAGVIREKFRQATVQPTLHEVTSYTSKTIGPFTVTWLPITHSTPETHALLIETPAGNLLHTADWKMDLMPVVGKPFDPKLFTHSHLPQIDAAIVDSTNALQPGFSKSEGDVKKGLAAAINQAEGRVFIGCFASNIARIKMLGDIASSNNRHLALAGRSLLRMTQIARRCGYLTDDFPEIPLSDLAYLPNAYSTLIATGSQGEVGSALYRLSRNQHPQLAVTPGDRIILSAKTIPGNETAVASMIKGFIAQGAEVIAADQHPSLDLHASGHPNAGELEQLYRLMCPRIAVPIHGESRHMAANASIAKQAGVNRCLNGSNGDLFVLSEPSMIKRNWLSTGRVVVDQ
jgi:ribonuclease J